MNISRILDAVSKIFISATPKYLPAWQTVSTIVMVILTFTSIHIGPAYAGFVSSDGSGQPYRPTKIAQACPSGLVWREKFDGDTLCVLPGERDANRRGRNLSVGPASACPSGLVWRERFDGDTVCVVPLERDENRRRRGLSVGR